MREQRRRSRRLRAIERLETRWLFSLDAFAQADSMIYVPPGTKLSNDELAALLDADQGAGDDAVDPTPVASSTRADEGGISANFDNSGLKWPQPGGRGNPATITYSLSNLLTSDLGGTLGEDTLYAAVEEALGLWAKYAPLNFIEVVDSGPAVTDNGYSGSQRPNLRIGHHPDDGRNNVLGHAYYPDGSGLAGDVHLDSDENWTTQPSFSTIDIIEVLTHELGHALGLGHEPSDPALMNPFYSGRYDGPGTGFLLADDIAGIRDIYGTGVGSVVPLARKPIVEGESFTLEEDLPLDSPQSVLDNDTDPLEGVLTAILVAAPAHGDVTLAADGTFEYTPDPNYFGADSFAYRANNGTASSEAATVSLTIRPTLDLPNGIADAYSVRTGNVLFTGQSNETVVKAGAAWRYLDDGSNQGTAWRAADFDDSAWSVGTAQLGYGEDDEATVVDYGGSASARHITTYFRHEFELSDIDRIETLNLQLLRDDGAVVYLNGVQIARSNLSSTFSYLTTALVDTTGSSETRFFSFAVDTANLAAGTLREGRNVLAVELHQSRANSDDLSFDLALAAVRDVPDDPVLNDVDLDRTGLLPVVITPPAHGALDVESDGSFIYTPTPGYVGQDTITYRAQSRNAATFVAPGSGWRYLDTGANLGTLWLDPFYNDVSWKTGDAQLGYGDGDEVTSIEFGVASNRYATTYFRKAFQVTDPDGIESLAAEVLRDDAAAIYLNGVEIYRDTNLAAGAGHSVYADGPVDDEDAFVSFDIPVELLLAGENVLAVEVHQSAANDGDLSFDFELTGQVVSGLTTITIDVTPTISGDVNFDGLVDLTDLNLVRNNFGATGAGVLGDSNGDDKVDLVDLNAVRNNFGGVAPAPMASPSPAAVETTGISEPMSQTLISATSRQSLAAKTKAWDLALVDWLATSESSITIRKRPKL